MALRPDGTTARFRVSPANDSIDRGPVVPTRRALVQSLPLGAAMLLAPPLVRMAAGEAGKTPDQTLVWNQVMLDAILASDLGNPQAQRMAAIVNVAMFDARNGVSRKDTPIFVTQYSPPATHR